MKKPPEIPTAFILLSFRIKLRCYRKTGRNHEMMAFIFPSVFFPLRRYIITFMISKERKICNLKALSQILGLIESLYFKQGINGITSAER